MNWDYRLLREFPTVVVVRRLLICLLICIGVPTAVSVTWRTIIVSILLCIRRQGFQLGTALIVLNWCGCLTDQASVLSLVPARNFETVEIYPWTVTPRLHCTRSPFQYTSSTLLWKKKKSSHTWMFEESTEVLLWCFLTTVSFENISRNMLGFKAFPFRSGSSRKGHLQQISSKFWNHKQTVNLHKVW